MNSSQIITFLADTFTSQQMTKGIVAVSGGIDSAVSLTLLTKALGPSQVLVALLPFADQSTQDAQLVADFNQIPAENRITVNIEPVVTAAAKSLAIEPTQSDHQLRMGNLKARARMMVIYDLAKKHQALVCGTENKSEKHLGYFTRFGDQASDIEPIQHLYKTQVRQLAGQLELPEAILAKPPSADLWSDQTDEQELGFTYQQADQVLAVIVDECQLEPACLDHATVAGVDQAVVRAVVDRVKRNHFKQLVPYQLDL